MDLNLNEEQLMIRDAARDFAQNEILPVAAHYDETGEFPLPIVKKMGQMGLMGIEVPEAYGGAGMDTVAYVLAMEEIAKADVATSTIMSVNNSLYCHGILSFGSEEQKRQWVPPVATGKALGAYALTEPMSGSDAGTMRTRAELSADGSHYLINGRKSWITSGPVADYLVLFAKTDPEASPRHRGISTFLIDASLPGLVRGKIEPKLGIRASATCEIMFEDYRCPVENLLGQPGEGFKIAMTVLDAGRIGIAAQALGVAEAAYEASLQYAARARGLRPGDRRFPDDPAENRRYEVPHRGQPPPHLPGCPGQDGGQEDQEAATRRKQPWPSSSPARPPCSSPTRPCRSTAAWATRGNYPVERYFRDAKITEIYEGTSEIQRMVIARNELGLR